MNKYFNGFPLVKGTKVITDGTTLAVYTMRNGAEYRVRDTKVNYIDMDYPEGGYVIHFIKENGELLYVDNSPDVDTLYNFISAINRKD